MPAFTFEKIAPPGRPAQQGPLTSSEHKRLTEHKHRTTIVQVLGRFVDPRPQRVDQSSLARRPKDLSKRVLPK